MSSQYVYVPESDRESRFLAEIERLTQANLKLCGEFMEQRKLIGELADALESKQDDFTLPECEHYFPLIKRAREETKP